MSTQAEAKHTPSQLAAAELGEALIDEVWWEETVSIGDFIQTIRLHPDRYAAQTMVAEILKRVGFDDLVGALKPFADLGVGSGPDEECDAHPYRILRGAIRNARAAIEKAEGRS